MSGYREIVTVAPMGKQAPDALRVTESVARRFASNVHFVHGLSQAAPNIGWTAESEGDLKRLRAMLEEDGRRLEAERQTVAKTVEEWRAKTGVEADLTVRDWTPEPAISTYLMTADLAILPRPGAVKGLDVEAVLLEAGRPVLLALGHSGAHVGDRVAIFWRSTPPTSHAVAASLPFLRLASAVKHFTVQSDRDDGSLERAATWLGYHGVQAETERLRPIDGASVGAVLLGAAGEFEADMIVMGAYGHSRLHEWALGGVTREVFRYAERPVFACH